MLVVVSPAKKLDWNPVEGHTTTPDFQDEAVTLAETARALSVEELQKLMALSPNLAMLNYDRFKAFEAKPEADATRPAVRAFAGDTYTGLEAASLDEDEMAFAQDHLRILSGLYGVLRPCDAIQPYRLEMGSRLKNTRGKNLYEFWGIRFPPPSTHKPPRPGVTFSSIAQVRNTLARLTRTRSSSASSRRSLWKIRMVRPKS